jgi:NDP-4-keto-2,6-dideoxyhexose 3-C-methyltransferase
MSIPLYNEIFRCRLCRSSHLSMVMEIGLQALTGCFPAAHEADPPNAPLELIRCRDCGLVQLKHSVQVSAMFGDSYGYRSGINETMRRHLTGIAEELSGIASLKSGDAVFDIGCNDATLLKAYTIAGLTKLGMDPIARMFQVDYPPDVRVLADFFEADRFRVFSGNVKPRAITSISMFYDLEDPSAFVSDIASTLASDGVWVLEQSYLPSMLERNAFDTICHEHLEYYAYSQIDRLVRTHGMRIFRVKFNDINGGSFQLWVCHDEASYPADTVNLSAVIEQEEALNLNSDAPYDEFRARVSAIGSALRQFLMQETQDGKQVYAYGASTKGNVLLQYLELDSALIRGCADKNPVKWGKRTPGSNIPIVSEDEARSRADYFLVLPWHFRDEFLARESDFRSRGGKFIFPLPALDIV